MPHSMHMEFSYVFFQDTIVVCFALALLLLISNAFETVPMA